ncbi:carboxylesterase 3 [Eucyclogobius newberryi]|uniref:carboxylesterase 3 n=1 Tax=Eucyclogobius newberryi TaxID=166745 RepID=UPI003B5B5BBC
MMRATLLLVCLLSVWRQAQGGPAGSTGPVLSLKNGRIRGELVTVRGSDRRVKQYLGIPFAQPPVGPLRLAAPQEAQPWDGERDCTTQPPMCIQDPEIVVNFSKTMCMHFNPPDISEDCLYLNVYSPESTAQGDKLPVLLWIHGGGLSVGAASQYDGSSLAAYENMVIVIIQYRLGILGFLSTGDEHAQGNWGFLDQLLGLHWVQDNIEVFGGDPQSVTIAGESAGGISASILTLSPLAKGLFQKAIFQSGVATLGTYTTHNPLAQTKMIANLTGCARSTTEEMVHCIRAMSKEQLVNATKQIQLYLGAVVDGVFLTNSAEELLKNQEVMKIPVMLGITNHEFGWILPQAFVPPGWEQGMNREAMMAVMNMFNPNGASSANSLIADEYLRGAQSPEAVRDRFTEVIGDLLMTLPVVGVAGYLSDAAVPAYLYEFAYRAQLFKDTRPSFVKADHADDVGFVFGACFWNGDIKVIGNFTKDEENLCRNMMSYWANFARTGSPNGPGLPSWPLYERQQQAYMELGPTLTVKHKLRNHRVHFITTILPQKLQELAAAPKKTID